MDKTVIEEIAKQLGIAVDQAGQFITEQLPNFAALKVLQLSIPLYIIVAATIILIIPCIISIYITCKHRKSDIEGKSKHRYSRFYSHDWTDYPSFWVFIWCASVFGLLLVILFTMIGFYMPKIIGWTDYPEAMLIDMALKAV